MTASRQEVGQDLFIGPQPAEDDLQELNQSGFGSVVNLRVPHEEETQLAPEDEGDQVRALNMTYLHIPVTMKQIRPEQVEEFSHAMGVLEKPVFVHCKSGKRAGIFALLHEATEQGWSAEETLQRSEKLGIHCDTPELKQFVRQYVDQHRQSA